MSVLSTAFQFVAACLLAGLGLFLASEAAQRLRRHLMLRTAGHMVAVLGGVVLVLAGGFWAGITVPW